MKNNRADGSKSRLNPAKNHTKKARKSFFIPPNKEDGEKKWIGKKWNNGFHTLSKKTTKQSKEMKIKKMLGKFHQWTIAKLY